MLYDELPEVTRTSLLRGYVEKSWRMPWLAEDFADLASAAVRDRQAYQHGLDLRAQEAEYDEVARALNVRYGEGLAVLMGEPGEPGLRGFRIGAFSTVTETVRNEDGTTTTTFTDLQTQVDDANDADRNED